MVSCLCRWYRTLRSLPRQTPNRYAVRAPVLLLSSMSLQSSDKRALVAGGTGRVGRAIATRLGPTGSASFAAGRADGDLRGAPAAHGARRGARSTELGGLDLVVHCRRRRLRARRDRGRDRGALGRGARRDGQGDVLPRPGGGAGAARVARRARDRRGRRLVPALDLVPGPLGGEGGAGDADARARARARARGAGLRRRARARSPSSRARRSAAPPRRCSGGSARRRTSQTRSPTWRAPTTSPGPRSSSTAGAS